MRAQVVLPTPLGPQKRKAWASWLCLIAFFSVVVICDCPTTVSKVCGLYFLAETTNLSILIMSEIRDTKSDFRDCNNKEVLDAVIFVFAHRFADPGSQLSGEWDVF